jgi:hypothetical protein
LKAGKPDLAITQLPNYSITNYKPQSAEAFALIVAPFTGSVLGAPRIFRTRRRIGS